MKTVSEIINAVENGDYDDEYAEYIMKHCAGDRIICNGDTLVCAMEDDYLFEDFIDYMIVELSKEV